MKVAQFVNTLSVADGGPARNAFELNVSLNQMPGVEAHLFSLTGQLHESVIETYDNNLGPLPIPGPRWVKISTNALRRAIGIGDLLSIIRKTDISIIHGYYLSWIAPIVIAHKIMRVPYVVTPHGSLTRKQQNESRIKKGIFDKTLGLIVRHNIGAFVTGSEIEAKELSDKFPKSPTAIGGVGTSMPERCDLSRPWNQPLVLLSLSRIAPKKRIDLSIAALAALKKNQTDAQLVVVGNGPPSLVSELRILAGVLGVSDDVHFTGQKIGNDKHEIFRSADIFLLPSDDENFGIGLAEALAHGVPAVASTSVAAAQFMSNESGKILTDPTGESMAAAIESLVDGERAQHSEAARASAMSNFSWPSIAENWAQTLRQFI